MGTSGIAAAGALACAADTWTPPILPTQSARRILCTGSKDTCTSQTSQNVQYRVTIGGQALMGMNETSQLPG